MGAEIANDVIGAAAVNPIAGAVLAPLAMVSGAIDVHEGTHERLRRLDQQQRAEQRKVAMNRVLESTAVDHPQHALMVGIVKSLSAHQDRLIKQAKREKGYGKARAGKGGAVIGASAAVVATAGLVIGGIVSVATLGVASALALLPPLGWGIAQAERNRRRVKDEHKSKWRQRAMRVLGFEMSREALQKKLAGTHPDLGPSSRGVSGRRIPAQGPALRRQPDDGIRRRRERVPAAPFAFASRSRTWFATGAAITTLPTSSS